MMRWAGEEVSWSKIYQSYAKERWAGMRQIREEMDGGGGGCSGVDEGRNRCVGKDPCG